MSKNDLHIFIKRFIKSWGATLILLAAILLFSLILRMAKIFIGQQPIFADEAIYVRWAQVMKAEPTLRFMPLLDGKQPLYMWILMFLLKPSFDPLIAGRVLSSVFGILTNFGVFVLAYLLFKRKKAALVASAIYAVAPISLFFDSMALVDATLTTLAVWFFIFLFLAVNTLRLDYSMISGFFLGGALLTKSPALYFTILTPISIVIGSFGRKIKPMLINLLKGLVLMLPILLIAYGMYNILRLGPNFHLITSRNADYVFPVSHLWTNPKDPFNFHIKELWQWMWTLGPGVLVFTFILGLIVGLKKYIKITMLITVWIFLPLFLNAMYAKVFTARYILFVMPFIFVLSSLFIIFKTKYQKLSYLMLILLVLCSLMTDYLLIFDIKSAPLPQSERTGYLEEWTAGYGIKEAANYLKTFQNQNPDTKIVVGTEGYFGTLPDGLQLYLSNYPQITVVGIGLGIKELPKQLVESKKAGNKTFLAINSSRLVAEPNSMNLSPVVTYVKPLRTVGTSDYINYGPREVFYLFEVK